MRDHAERSRDLTEAGEEMTRTQEHFANVLGAFDDALGEQLAESSQHLDARLHETGDPQATLRALETELAALEALMPSPDAVIDEERRRMMEWEGRAMSAVQAADHDLARVAIEEVGRIGEKLEQADVERAEYRRLREQYLAAIQTLREKLAHG